MECVGAALKDVEAKRQVDDRAMRESFKQEVLQIEHTVINEIGEINNERI